MGMSLILVCDGSGGEILPRARSEFGRRPNLSMFRRGVQQAVGSKIG
jgi:hypothetical protein